MIYTDMLQKCIQPVNFLIYQYMPILIRLWDVYPPRLCSNPGSNLYSVTPVKCPMKVTHISNNQQISKYHQQVCCNCKAAASVEVWCVWCVWDTAGQRAGCSQARMEAASPLPSCNLPQGSPKPCQAWVWVYRPIAPFLPILMFRDSRRGGQRDTPEIPQ